LWVSSETPDQDGQGGQRRQFHQINALLARGHEITVLVPASLQNDRSVRRIAPVIRPRLHLRGRFGRLLIGRAHRVIAAREWDAIIVSHRESWWLMPERTTGSAPVLLDMHNVMSYWHRAAGRNADASEALAQEAVAVRDATVVSTCSETECRRLAEMHPKVAAGKTFVAPLGIEPLEWPEQDFERTEPTVALFGSWAWRPNSLGLAWFLKEVWPLVRAGLPDAVAFVAGSGIDQTDDWPDGAQFIGRVSDLAAFTASASVVAVPVLEGVGASVKFAEALATGASVVATPDGANAFDEPPAFVSADPEQWATWILDRLRHRSDEEVPAPSRAVALRELTWDAAVAPIHEWLTSVVAGSRPERDVSS
jgi:glycosyltransferase involved in cell wall biosynthesis